MNLLDVHWLFASLIWGSVGVGYFIYGRKQQSLVALFGGIIMVAASYFAGSALTMSAIGSGSILLVYWLMRAGY